MVERSRRTTESALALQTSRTLPSYRRGISRVLLRRNLRSGAVPATLAIYIALRLYPPAKPSKSVKVARFVRLILTLVWFVDRRQSGRTHSYRIITEGAARCAGSQRRHKHITERVCLQILLQRMLARSRACRACTLRLPQWWKLSSTSRLGKAWVTVP